MGKTLVKTTEADFMAQPLSKRGFIWMAVGLALFIAGFFLERPLVLRGTRLPFWPFVLGLGLLLVGWDLVKRRRGGDSNLPPA